MNMRAQPEGLVLEDLTLREKPPVSDRYAKVNMPVRLPAWMKRLISEAAEREGLSQNAWCERVLAEFAKVSQHGWRSVPANDEPRWRPEPEPDPEPEYAKGGVVNPPPYVPYTPPPYTFPHNPQPVVSPGWITTNPTIISGTGSSSNPGNGSFTINGVNISENVKSISLHNIEPSATWTPPDDDIPELT